MTVADIIFATFVLLVLYVLVRLCWGGDAVLPFLDEDTAWLEELNAAQAIEDAKRKAGAPVRGTAHRPLGSAFLSAGDPPVAAEIDRAKLGL